ncbi:MAG: hypothetical protein DRO11_06625 [Methanobacteriota archaeon]|nr:MAG: hypothetical protein DRO11_06625 [Euryarchaeota archaeon]
MARRSLPAFIWLAFILGALMASPGVHAQAAGNQTAANQTLEGRVATLERELEIKGRVIETLMRRTATQMDKIEDLEHRLELLRRNVSRFLSFATPSKPRYFRVRRIKRTADGSYKVTLQWKANPKEDKVTQYAIWYAEKGGPYRVGCVINSTNSGLVKATISGLEKDSVIVFKMYAKNAVAHSEAVYREARMISAAPVLMHKLKILGALTALAAFGWAFIYLLWRKK